MRYNQSKYFTKEQAMGRQFICTPDCPVVETEYGKAKGFVLDGQSPSETRSAKTVFDDFASGLRFNSNAIDHPAALHAAGRPALLGGADHSFSRQG